MNISLALVALFLVLALTNALRCATILPIIAPITSSQPGGYTIQSINIPFISLIPLLSLQITFSSPISNLTPWNALSSTSDNIQFSLVKLSAGLIGFNVSYPSANTVPVITKVLINGITLCDTPAAISVSSTSKPSSPFYTNSSVTTSSGNTSSSTTSLGTRSSVTKSELTLPTTTKTSISSEITLPTTTKTSISSEITLSTSTNTSKSSEVTLPTTTKTSKPSEVTFSTTAKTSTTTKRSTTKIPMTTSRKTTTTLPTTKIPMTTSKKTTTKLSTTKKPMNTSKNTTTTPKSTTTTPSTKTSTPSAIVSSTTINSTTTTQISTNTTLVPPTTTTQISTNNTIVPPTTTIQISTNTTVVPPTTVLPQACAPIAPVAFSYPGGSVIQLIAIPSFSSKWTIDITFSAAISSLWPWNAILIILDNMRVRLVNDSTINVGDIISYGIGFNVNYPIRNAVPAITSISFNGVKIC